MPQLLLVNGVDESVDQAIAALRSNAPWSFKAGPWRREARRP